LQLTLVLLEMQLGGVNEFCVAGEKIVAKVSTKTLTQFSESTINNTVEIIMKQKEIHIFSNNLHPKPWLNELSGQMEGNQNFIYEVLKNANGKIIPKANNLFDTPVTVGGVNFFIRGRITNGLPIINSIYLPKF